MFEFIFVIGIAAYFLIHVYFTVGLNKNLKSKEPEEMPSVSVIVAARNEEKNIYDCMLSLSKLDYPADKLEILLVNDKSVDRTPEIMQSFIKDRPVFKYLETPEKRGHLKGKTNALAYAIKESKGEIIFTTDADCEVQPGWIKSMAGHYSSDTGMVCGFTGQKGNTIFEGMQDVDFMYLLAAASGAMNLNKPLSCIGNNMSFRKSVYFETGGYEKLPFSITEDSALMFAFHRLKKYKLKFPVEAESVVMSKPCQGYKIIYRQKKRWGIGGLHSPAYGFWIMGVSFVVNAAMLLFPFFYSTEALFIVLFKLMTDYFFISPVYNKLNRSLRLKSFAAFEVYYIIYVLILPFIVWNKKVTWKGRVFK